MSKRLILNNHGTTSENERFRAPSGAIVVDRENPAIHVHDGVKVGGHRIEPLYKPEDNGRYALTRDGWSKVEENTYFSVTTGLVQFGSVDSPFGKDITVPAPYGMVVTDVMVRIAEGQTEDQVYGLSDVDIVGVSEGRGMRKVRYTPDGTQYFLYERRRNDQNSYDYNLHQVDATTGEVINTIADIEDLTDFQITPDGTHIVIVAPRNEDDSVVKVFEIDGWVEKTITNVPNYNDDGYGKQVVFTPNGSHYIVTTSYGTRHGEFIVDTATHTARQLPNMGNDSWIPSFVISPDGKRLYYGGINQGGPSIFVYDLENETLLEKINVVSPYTGDGEIGKIAISPDGRRLAVGFSQGPVVYNTVTWEVIPASKRPTHPATVILEELEFTPDGRYLIVQYNDAPNTMIFETSTWETVFSNQLGDGGGHGVAVHPTEKTVLLLSNPSDLSVNGIFELDTGDLFGGTASWGNFPFLRVIMNGGDGNVEIQSDVVIPVHTLGTGATIRKASGSQHVTNRFILLIEGGGLNILGEIVLIGYRPEDGNAVVVEPDPEPVLS